MKPIKLQSVEAPMPHSGRAVMVFQLIQTGTVFFYDEDRAICLVRAKPTLSLRDRSEEGLILHSPREGDELFEILRRPEDGLCSYMLQSTGTPIRVLAKFGVYE